MQNRLRNYVQYAFFMVVLHTPLAISAQASAFNFQYPGPNGIQVGANCQATLSGNFGTPIVSSALTPAATITSSAFDAAASGFTMNDTWTAGAEINVKWKVTDNQGNSHTYTIPITFLDLIPPSFTAPPPATLTFNSIAEVPAPTMTLSVADNCSPATAITQVFSQTTPPALCQGGSFTRTWEARDLSGNVATFKQTIQINADTSPPQVTSAPQNGSGSCSIMPGSYTTWLNTQLSNFVVSDPSGIASITHNAPPSYASCFGVLTVTFRAEDKCGFSTTRTATFTVMDNQGPVVIKEPGDKIVFCSPQSGHIDSLAAWIARHGGASVTDACSTQFSWFYQVDGNDKDSSGVVNAFKNSFNALCETKFVGTQFYSKVSGLVRVDFFAKDPCDNITFVGRGEFAARDTTPPGITGQALTIEQCGSGNDQSALQAWINNHGNAQLTDDCSTASWTNFSYTTSDGQSGNGNFNAGPYPVVQANQCSWYADVTFRAGDECGNNNAAKTLRFEIKDTQGPTIGGFAPVTTVYCPNQPPSNLTATAIDNCDLNVTPPTYVVEYADTICTGSYTMRVKWSATDACGNIGTAVQTFLIRDTIRPDFTLVPQDLTASCQNYQSLALPVIGTDVKATDQCGVLNQITLQSADNKGSDPNACNYYNFIITRTFTASDACGNTRTAQQRITVSDTQAPTFTGPSDFNVVCEAIPLNPTPPLASDQCSPLAGPVVQNNAPVVVAGPCDDSYTLTYTWKATDVCGNTSTFNQYFHVQDTSRPSIVSLLPVDITVDCHQIPAPPAIGSLVGADNCDESVAISMAQSEIRDPNPANCARWSSYIIRREWTAADNCGNTRRYTQNIVVMDNTPPALSVKDTVMIPAASGVCGADVLAPTPLSVFDFCSSPETLVTLRDTGMIVNTSGSPAATTPVDTILFVWSSPNLPPNKPVTGNATLVIELQNADAEQAAEHFRVFGENGIQIGITSPTSGQCGSGSTTFTIPGAHLNDWLTDGQLTLKLAPNGVGGFAVNAICPGGSARASISYAYADPQIPISVTYSINNGPVANFPPASAMFLPVGLHTVKYTATDCAGNATTAVSMIRIADEQPPIVSAAGAQTAYSAVADCNTSFKLPFPGITENCVLSGSLEQASAVVPVTFELDPNAGFVPSTVTLSINSLATNALTGGTLKIRHKGDNANTGEFFRVSDENNTFLAATTYGVGNQECTTTYHETQIPVTANQINAWAADGTASFKLSANTDAASFNDFINPCGPLGADNKDGKSSVQAVLEYNYAIVNYTIKNSANTVVKSGQLVGAQGTVSLPAGKYTVSYTVGDAFGGMGTASYPLTVRDTVRPQAKCTNRTIFTNASGLINYTLTPAEVNNNSIDNCSGSNLTFSLSQTAFTCTQAGSVVPVTLTVKDSVGNTSSCVAQVRIETESFQPTYTPDICEGNALQLFANPPQAPGNPNYLYSWVGPAFNSNAANPMINNATPANEGTYRVTVTGSTGCTAVGIVQVQLIGLPLQPQISAVKPVVCVGENTILRTPEYLGANVSYSWYAGMPPNGTFLKTTTVPEYIINTPAAGNYQYYVRITDLNCTSIPSSVLNVIVQTPPSAAITQAPTFVCEGGQIALGTDTQGQGITYVWAGPNNFNSVAQQPPVIQNATQANEGVYSLVVYQNGCPSSNTALVFVDVRAKPATPALAGGTAVCQGSSVNLTTTPGFSQYNWYPPSPKTPFSTLSNAITLNNVTSADSGAWRVSVVSQGCVSNLSAAQLVQIQSFPKVVAKANTPLCQGDLLQLQATADQNDLSYQWKGPGDFSVFSQNTTVGNPLSGDFIIKAVTSFGCSGSDTIQVEIVPPPIINGITSNAPPCVDGQSAIQLQAATFTLNGPLTYDWKGPSFNSSQPMPVIPTATTLNNGSYTLIVKDKYGCASAPKTYELRVNDIPPLPLLSLTLPRCVGQSANLILDNALDYTNLVNPEFIWQTPKGTIKTNQPVLLLTELSKQDSGLYSVAVKTPTCTSPSSGSVNLEVNTIPVTPAVTSNSPVCEGSDIILKTKTIQGASYFWTGPAEFTASSQTPVRPQATLLFRGKYALKVSVKGCISTADSFNVDVIERPQTPLAQFDQAVCLEQPDSLRLFVAQGTTTPGAKYKWYNAATQTPVTPDTFAVAINLTQFNGLKPGKNRFYVVASKNGCTSLPSSPVEVQFDTIPDNKAFAGADFNACDQSPFTLNAVAPSKGSGRWRLLSGTPVSIANPDTSKTNVGGAFAGNNYQFSWTLSNGACRNYSRDTVVVKVSKFEQALVALPSIDLCFKDTVRLVARKSQAAAGAWSQPLAQQSIGITLTRIDDTTVLAGNLIPGRLFFYWTLNDIGCGKSEARADVFVVGAKAFGGIDQVVCVDDSCALLNATLDNFETGRWRAAGSAVNIATPNSKQSVVCQLQSGSNIFYWETNKGVCGAQSLDTVEIFYAIPPEAESDLYDVAFGSRTLFNVLLNDKFQQPFKVEVLDNPRKGVLTPGTAPGEFAYQPNIGQQGSDNFRYQVCRNDAGCTDSNKRCSEATVTFKIGEPGDCEPPSLITPNNDGLNDAFFIPCVAFDGGSDTEVSIFNQYGDLVYHDRPYDASKLWDGTFNGQPLPASTYFYVVQNHLDGTVKRGFVIIQR